MIRAARTAGRTAATTPTTAASPRYVPSCAHGSANCVMPWLCRARTTAAPSPLPTAMPSSAPNTEMTTASTVTIRIACARRSPMARSRPSSRVRSRTDRASVFTMPSTAMRMASASRIWIIVERTSERVGEHERARHEHDAEHDGEPGQ